MSENEQRSEEQGDSWVFAAIIAVVALGAAIVVPSFVKGRNTSQQNACIGNLRMIDAGKEQASMVYKLTDGDTVATTSVDQYEKGETIPLCPAGGTYTYNKIGTAPECSIQKPTSHVLP